MTDGGLQGHAPRLLVTGFGPFPKMPENPTSRLVARLADDPPVGVTARVLATEWASCRPLAAEAAGFDAVVMFGVAGGSRRIRYERVAHPVAASSPDAAGRLPEAPPPTSRRPAFDVPALVARARAAGFPVVLSSSAGTYICNAGYAAALAGNSRTLFVHVPQTLPRGPLSDDGLERHARWLIATVAARLTAAGRRAPAR